EASEEGCSAACCSSSRRRHTRWKRDWSSDVCSSDLVLVRARVMGEPLPQRSDARLADSDMTGEWMTVRAAAERVGVTHQWFLERSEGRRVGVGPPKGWAPPAAARTHQGSGGRGAWDD